MYSPIYKKTQTNLTQNHHHKSNLKLTKKKYLSSVSSISFKVNKWLYYLDLSMHLLSLFFQKN